MGGYLEAYGAGEERRVRRVRLLKISLIVLVCASILGAVLYAVFKNHAEERQVKTFIEALRKPDYQAAYRMWGCNESHPCRDYSFDKFMEDWGPQKRARQRSLGAHWPVTILRNRRAAASGLPGHRAGVAMGGAERASDQLRALAGMPRTPSAYRRVAAVPVQLGERSAAEEDQNPRACVVTQEEQPCFAFCSPSCFLPCVFQRPISPANGRAHSRPRPIPITNPKNTLAGSGGPNESKQHPFQDGKVDGDRLKFEVPGG